jgi:hypothetical protein
MVFAWGKSLELSFTNQDSPDGARPSPILVLP